MPYISIHAPTRGATQSPTIYVCDNPYFNPRSHERSDGILGLLEILFHISIHAPTRGATNTSAEKLMPLCISIHAPTRGATGHYCQNVQDHTISIHAPTRGATVTLPATAVTLPFQSTLPREERQQYCTKNLFIFIQYRQ